MARPYRSLRQHYLDKEDYFIPVSAWLDENAATLATVDPQVLPNGISLDSYIINGKGFTITISGGAGGNFYIFGSLLTDNTGRQKFYEVKMSITGSSEVVDNGGSGEDTAPLIEGALPVVGTPVRRLGSDWTYQVVLTASQPGATATVRIRVGNTAETCISEFDVVNVAVGATPNGQGLYVGAQTSFGNLLWGWHAADIVGITGVNASVKVIGVGQ